MGSDSVVALFAIMAVFGFPMAALVVSRWLSHRERMEMIRHGMVPPLGKVDWRAMRAGPRPGPGGYPGGHPGETADARLGKGIKVAFIGLALTIGLSFIGYDDAGPLGVRLHPGPWLLGGIVPLFVGLAQIVTALLSGATLGAPRRWEDDPPQDAAAPGNASPPPGQSFEGPYTYRPGPTQELRPPVPPPERRP